MEQEKNSMLFNSLVYSFSMQTMIQLGKLKNPVTNETDRDLEAARVTIDMLEMLKSKTQNNLSEDESRFLDQTISELKLNFVDEKNKDEKKEEPKIEEAGNNGTEEKSGKEDSENEESGSDQESSGDEKKEDNG